MQTFLPYPDFAKSARVLDDKRLGKQRVEAYQILRTLLGLSEGWERHPAVKMWQGHELLLTDYILAVCTEWTNRGYKDSILKKTFDLVQDHRLYFRFEDPPEWLGSRIHESHRSNLLRKFPEHYRRYWPELLDNLPYIWPA